MKNIKCKHNFTLVEVLIAMGICVFGVCSIMVLFPIGANASRDAVISSYADDAAQQIIELVKWSIAENKDTAFNAFTGWTIGTPDAYIATDTVNIPDSASEEIPDTDYKKVGDKLSSANSSIMNFLSNSNDDYMTMRVYDDPEGNTDTGQLYRADFQNNDDFSCWIALTASPIAVNVNGSKKNLPRAAVFHVKVVWPADAPAARRQSATYDFEVYCEE